MTNNDFSLALDLGTTTLVGRLLGGDGAVLAEGRCANPQGVVAADIVRRLEAARYGRAAELQGLLAEGIGALTDGLLQQAGVPRERLGAVALAANPGIAHLLAAESVEGLLFPPHRPVFRGGAYYPASRFALDLACPVYLFPLVSGYVGGDLVAFLFGQDQPGVATLYVDIGTNAELALYAEGRWLVSSVAAGPAFEGGEIACGMQRGPGAVEDVSIAADRLVLKTLGEGPPRGICGSGLAAAVAAGRAGGLIDAAGTLRLPGEVATNLARYLGERQGQRVLRLYRDARTELYLAQDDIRAFQLAKGAVHAGVACLLRRAELPAEALRQVVVTGAFGSALGLETLKKVAMLPESVLEKVRFEGDGVLRGAVRFLSTPGAAARVAKLAASLRSYPLSGTPAFEKAFIAALNF
ncbi:ASKHA domain-containing protein [Geoalkalibacter halelectricus]|uniref:ASKHA domain-containing protein n=1 Tax=Geoalkalibacter halelectricus TaxID=2847045 RepID=UPI00266EA213|nr:ASKHA domain-containing protein [Geoalkalibacter halelectricus]MDO3378793.1 ASKHA domain-containing protein [Geoalkalibacter halelectricus]